MKKRIKKAIKNKKIKIIVLVILLLIVIGLVGLKIYHNRNDNYLNNTVKSRCEKGYYCNYVLLIFGNCCRKCSKDAYCPDGIKNVPCPNGTRAGGEGSKVESDCKYCKDETKYVKNGKCVPCEIGYYCQRGTLNKCPDGETTTKKGAKYKSECIKPTPTPTPILRCTGGQYNKNGKCTSCPKCNGGTTCFNAPTGSTSVNQCRGTVPAGKYITCTSSGCTVKSCEGNTYSTSKVVTYSESLKTSCTSCGKNNVNSSHTGCKIVTCTNGQYKNNGKCYSCPKCNGNTTCFSAPPDSTSVNQCRGTVPAGKYITCTSSGCIVRSCAGNTYSTSKSVTYSSSLRTFCSSCKNKKANQNHTACV